jgi:hypothetical protein
VHLINTHLTSKCGNPPDFMDIVPAAGAIFYDIIHF